MINKFLNGEGQNPLTRTLLQFTTDWQNNFNNYLNGLDKPELPNGLHYNNKGEVVMSPDEVIKRKYSFITDNTGKIKLLDKDNNIIFNDVLNQPNLHDWIDKNKLWNKPKSLSEASLVASIRNPKGMKTIRDAFNWGGNVAGGFVATPVLAAGVAEAAPYLYSKAPQFVSNTLRMLNPGSLGESILGKDAATQAIKTGMSVAEKYPLLMANTKVGALLNAGNFAYLGADALNLGYKALNNSNLGNFDKSVYGLNAALSLPIIPFKGIENAKVVGKIPFTLKENGNLNLFGLFLNRGPWKLTKTLWRLTFKDRRIPFVPSSEDVLNIQQDFLSKLLGRTEYRQRQGIKTFNVYKITNPYGASTIQRVETYYPNKPGLRARISDFDIYENKPLTIPILSSSTPEEITNFKAYRQSINDLLKEDGLVAGSTVGYSNGYIQGGMNNDTEIITTASRLKNALNKMKFTKVGVNSIGGDVGTSPLAKGKTPQVEYDIIDEDINGNAKGTLAHQIFQALHPEEARQFYKANIDNDVDSYTLSLPIKAEQLLQELRQEGNMEKVQMLDMFGAGINAKNSENFKKHATRAYNVLLNPLFVPQVRSTLDLMGQKQFGPKFELFSSKISDFTNVEDNKKFLNEIINANNLKYFTTEQIEEIAKNPELMKNVFDYFNFNNFVGNRGMTRWSPLVERDMTPSELREGFTSNVQYGGGSVSGVGLNMTSGAWKAGEGFGAINGTRLLKTTYDPNPQSIPQWMEQYKRITNPDNFPNSLYATVGDPNEIPRIEAESRKLNLPVWRSTNTKRGLGAYNGSYAGPLYSETNPDNLFILHGVFPENGGLFTPKFKDLYSPKLTSMNDILFSNFMHEPFDYLSKNGYTVEKMTDPVEERFNTIFRHKNWVEPFKQRLRDKLNLVNKDIDTRKDQYKRFKHLNSQRENRIDDLSTYLPIGGAIGTLLPILGGLGYIQYQSHKNLEQIKRDNDFTESAKRYGSGLINELSFNNTRLSDNELKLYDRLFNNISSENLPREVLYNNDLRHKLAEAYNSYLTSDGTNLKRYLDYMNQLIKDYGYLLINKNGNLLAVTQ